MSYKHEILSVLVVLCWAALGSARGSELVIDSFSYPSNEAAAGAWRPSPESPPPQKGAPGVTFPCPFRKDIQRVFWDRRVNLDLSGFTSFDFELCSDRPQAFRKLNIYFKSGQGWYVWGGTIPEAGRQKLLALKSEFTTEGKPAGWSRIEAVRISAWRGIAQNSTLTFYRMAARSDSILIVRNTLSSPKADERAFAGRIADRLSRWLGTLRIPHGIVTDEDVIEGRAQGACVIMLPHNPHPPPIQIAALKKFVAGGGKLIVFYGAEPALADLMRVKLGSYQKAEAPGRWSSFSFTRPEEWHVPKRIFQESSNIMPAYPADSSARTIAWWEDARGNRAREPAWIVSPAGLWMSHVLLDDDTEQKQQLLLGLLGYFEPSVWRAAARAMIDRTGKIDSFACYEDAFSEISRLSAKAAEPDRVHRLLKESAAARRRMIALNSQGNHVQALDQAKTSHSLLVEAYGRAQHPKSGEFRGVWNHSGTGWYPGDWNRTCRALAENGINAVFPNVFWGGVAHYPSRILPGSHSLRLFGDQLDQCIKAAGRHGIEVHAWKICWNLGAAPADVVQKMKREGRLQTSLSGSTTMWLCPLHPQNIALEIAALKEVATNYPVHGIHLDYVRFPGANYCFCETCRSAFEKWLGRQTQWPAAVKPGGAAAAEFRKWRTGQITRFVRTAREELRKVNPQVKLSAAVWGNYPQCADSIGQDWGVWLKHNYVDFVCPMNYTDDPTRFAALTASQLDLPRSRGRVFPGLGVTSSQSRLGPDQAIEQIVTLRRLGAGGFLLFDMSHTLREETLPALRWGLTRE